MNLLPAWLRGGNDRELARTIGGESATAKVLHKQRQRGSMGRGHRNATEADHAAQRWEQQDRRRFGG